MYRVNCTLISNEYATLKKVLESMLEATEKGYLCFYKAGEYRMSLRSIDALYATQSMVEYTQTSFENGLCIEEDVGVHVDLKVMQDFVGKCGCSKRIRFMLDYENRWTLREERRSITLQNRPDKTPYEEWTTEVPVSHFSISSIELGSIFLDMSVSGVEADIQMDTLGHVTLTCTTDSNMNRHFIDCTVLQTSSRQPFKAGPFIAKFLKLFYNMSFFSDICSVRLYNNRVVIQMHCEDTKSRFQFVVYHYVGPRRIFIPAAYRNMTMT